MEGRSVSLDQLEWIGEVIRPLVQQRSQLAQFLDDGQMTSASGAATSTFKFSLPDSVGCARVSNGLAITGGWLVKILAGFLRNSAFVQSNAKKVCPLRMALGTSRVGAERGMVRKNWLAALDDFRNWLIREAA